jgi:excinuclease UvrABC ATPase subunit
MKRLLLLTLLVLSGCSSLAFDPVQFDRLVSVSERAEKMIGSCKKPDVIDAQTTVLLSDVSHMKSYANHRSKSPEISNSINTLHSLILELSSRYTPKESPSVLYCQEKLENISKTAGAISDTIGRLY